MGAIRKPCAKVSERAQISIRESTVGQYSVKSAAKDSARNPSVRRHALAVGVTTEACAACRMSVSAFMDSPWLRGAHDVAHRSGAVSGARIDQIVEALEI